MPRYINTSGATLTYQGVTFKPHEVHDVPSPIHSRIMFPTDLPCTEDKESGIGDTEDNAVQFGFSGNSLNEAEPQVDEILSDTVEAEKPEETKPKITSKKSNKKTIKEETDGTDNNK